MKKRSRRAVAERVTAVVDTAQMLENPLKNANQERFCQAILTEASIVAAAVKAGYAPGTARSQGSRMLTNDNIQRRVAWLLTEAAQSGVLTRQAVMAITRMAAPGWRVLHILGCRCIVRW